LYRRAVDTGDETLFFASDDNKYSDAWLRDGSLLYVAGNATKLARVSTSGEAKETILIANQFQNDGPRVSPDGKWLTYTSDESGEWLIHIAYCSVYP
jgi:Tol biopolymer transport system component